MQTTKYKEISCYILEDLLGCVEDHCFLLCIAKELDDKYSSVLSDATMEQSMPGIGGEVCRISGRYYYCIKAMMDQAHAHQDLVSGAMQGVALESNFQRNEGFTV